LSEIFSFSYILDNELSTDKTKVYVDNSPQFVWNDIEKDAVPLNNILNFCIDDFQVPNENDTGVIHRIEIYNQPLQECELPPTPTPGPSPTPEIVCAPCGMDLKLTKSVVLGETSWTVVYGTNNISINISGNNLILSDTQGVSYFNTTIQNYKDLIKGGELEVPGCPGMVITGFCFTPLDYCYEFIDEGLIAGGQEGARRRYFWNRDKGFFFKNGDAVTGCPWVINGSKLRFNLEDDINCKKYNKYVQKSSCKIRVNYDYQTSILMNNLHYQNLTYLIYYIYILNSLK
jgi:hypothetical protein